ncbi:MAG: hypothetical protein ABI433_19340 [Burkholderiaceae bacterium]
MRQRAVIGALGGLLALGSCGTSLAANEFSGQTRPSWAEQGPNPNGPLAQAAGLSPGITTLPRSGATLETELRASGHGLSGTVTLQQQRLEGTPARSKAWVNELYAATGSGGWQFSAGKRIVAWDVGHGFRPNDVVQQETRRTLLASTAEGRPLLMAEYFDASTAWSFVAVNPTRPHAQRGAEEPAFAARLYQRDGAVDWHGFARYGAHTGGSIGAAAAWVASDALELHASLRYLNAADSTALDPATVGASTTGLARSNPWSDATVRHATQMLVGGTWTNAQQLSVLAEAWWDGTALSDAQWNDWNARNRQLTALVGTPAPNTAVAGNLAWQANAFGASSNLRRTNLFMRVSWTLDKWQPAIDLLYTPADAGRTLTASLGWQGDRVRMDAGLRVYGGPGDAVLAQLPARRVAYVAGTWSF